MKSFSLKYFPINSHGLLIQWPELINLEILKDIISFKNKIEENHKLNYIQNSYNELLMEFPEPIHNIKTLINELNLIYRDKKSVDFKSEKVYIPVCYEPEFGIDLIQLCYNLNLSSKELIQLHTENTYTLYSIGFLPGFMYLGGLNPLLYYPRKENPRQTVPKGAVGIGGNQTGIYPQTSPGGWQIIGNSPISLFDLKNDPPFFANIGDQIQFFSISKQEYEIIQIQNQTGIYQCKKEVISW